MPGAILFDTETTGLFPCTSIREEVRPRILEFYAMLLDLETGNVSNELEFLCNPEKPSEPDAFKAHGIHDAQVRQLPPFKSYAESVQRFFCENEYEYIIGHNLTFDVTVLNWDMERSGLSIPWPHYGNLICTVEQTLHLKGHRLKLSDLHEMLIGRPFENHRARADVEALGRCVVKLKQIGEL